MSGVVRIGVVGAGWWSSHAHLPAIVEHGAAELVGIADRDVERAHLTAELFGAQYAVDSVAKLINCQVDAAVVATPQNAHHSVVAELLDAGIHVLVEKPMTVDPREAWDLVRRARQRGVHLQVGHTFPHDPLIAPLRDAYRDGALGVPVSVSSLFATAVAPLYRGDTESARDNTDAPFAPKPTTYSDSHSGGQLYTQLSHAAAVVLDVTNDDATEVSAVEQRLDLEVDMADALSARMRSGSIATFHSTGSVVSDDARVEEYRFFGTEGHALLDTARGTLELVIPRRHTPLKFSRSESFDLVRAPVRNLIGTVLGNEVTVVSGELGARVVDLIAAARESVRAKALVKVPLIDQK